MVSNEFRPTEGRLLSDYWCISMRASGYTNYILQVITSYRVCHRCNCSGVWSPSPSGHSGYVGERTELSGIFVKSIAERSAAGVDGRIDINDQIISVDGQSLQGFSNHQVTIIFRSDNKNFILSKTSN